MKILIACDKFKGSLTASEACKAIAEGLREGSKSESLEIRTFPIADGGEGIAEAILTAKGGRWIKRSVRGPMGDSVEAAYALLDDGRTAIIEMAAASGISLVMSGENDPLRATSYGTGELLLDAIERGVGEIVLGIGGSATNDGGTGLAEALGFRFFNREGEAITDLPFNLESVTRIETPKLALPSITVACDVGNLLLGDAGCTRVYGPQKGIREEEFSLHEARLAHLVELFEATGRDAAAIPGSGAAGGLGFGALVFLKARIVPGFDLVAEHTGFVETVAWADLVITGEGRLDRQSLEGKGPCGVIRLARSAGKSTLIFCGMLEDRSLEDALGTILEIRDPSLSLSENMATGATRLRTVARDYAPLLRSPDADLP